MPEYSWWSSEMWSLFVSAIVYDTQHIEKFNAMQYLLRYYKNFIIPFLFYLSNWLGSEPSTLEIDVYVRRYALLVVLARNDDDDDAHLFERSTNHVFAVCCICFF